MLTANVYARSKCQYQPTGAVTVICFSALTLYLVIGILLTLAQSTIGTDNSEIFFTGAMVVLTLGMFVATAIIYGVDLYTQQIRAPFTQKASEHALMVERLRKHIEECRSLDFGDSQHQIRCRNLLKSLEMIASALSHSNGCCGPLSLKKEDESHAELSDFDKTLNGFEQILCDATHSKIVSTEGLDQLERLTSSLVATAEREGIL